MLGFLGLRESTGLTLKTLRYRFEALQELWSAVQALEFTGFRV